jgi:flavin reductase (DIM6/NTAB) family NADH-FMN oxidoreductase RutF
MNALLPATILRLNGAMKRLESRKLYYGFPVYVLTYRDSHAASGWSMTTGSSSYSLGWTAVFGVTADTNAASCIAAAGECTLSLVTRGQMPVVERLGSASGTRVSNKIEHCGARLAHLPNNDAAAAMNYFAGSPAVLDLEVRSHEEFDGYVNFVARVRSRYVEDDLLDAEGALIPQRLEPVNFVGDVAQNIYRFPSHEADDTKRLGDFLKGE